MRARLLALLAVAFLAGCGGATPGGSGPKADQSSLDQLKPRMTELFSALEMYSADHSMAYPETAKELVPKYLDAVPTDPLGGSPLVYQKTERGYLISTTADYSAAGAAAGYPQMNQDGFFALKAEDFPSEPPEP